jgi:hypothetical protein
MTPQWNFTAVGAVAIDIALRERENFERRLRSGGKELSPAPRPAPIERAEPPELEMIAIIRRIHEASHLVIGYILGLEPEYISSQRNRAHVKWRVPSGRRAMVSFLISLAASKAGQRRFGAKALDWRCGDDDEKIARYARKVTPTEADAEFLIDASYRMSEKLVEQRWDDINYIVDALGKLGDEIVREDLPLLLRNIEKEREQLLHRRGFVSAEHWLRRGLSKPRGYDPGSREIDAVLSTGAAVRRRDWDGEFDEVLGMKPGNVRLARLNQGAAVLDSHNWHQGVGAMLGGIVPGSARLENGALTARIKFSRGSDLAQRVTKDLQDGIQIPLSVGYKVHAMRDDRSTVPVTRIATDWEPLEVSLVPISAEETGTGFRVAA